MHDPMRFNNLYSRLSLKDMDPDFFKKKNQKKAGLFIIVCILLIGAVATGAHLTLLKMKKQAANAKNASIQRPSH